MLYSDVDLRMLVGGVVMHLLTEYMLVSAPGGVVAEGGLKGNWMREGGNLTEIDCPFAYSNTYEFSCQV